MSLDTEFERCWPWLAPALARGDERGLSKDQLKALILCGRAMLWPGEGGALVTECVVTPEGRFLHCWLGGGSMKALLALRPGVEAWGRAMGCELASINGRKGWRRLVGAQGYAPFDRELRKRL